MIKTFTADNLSQEVQDGFDIIAFYNDDDYLFIQRHQQHGGTEDEGVYIEFKDSLHCGFDVIQSIELAEKQVRIQLKSPLYQLSSVTGFAIECKALEKQRAALSEGIRKMFKDRLVNIVID